MNKTDIIKAIVERHGEFTAKEVGSIVDEFIEVIHEGLVKGEKISLLKFGTFEVVQRAAREGRNPQTGESITIAASKTPKFKASKVLKDAVNS